MIQEQNALFLLCTLLNFLMVMLFQSWFKSCRSRSLELHIIWSVLDIQPCLETRPHPYFWKFSFTNWKIIYSLEWYHSRYSHTVNQKLLTISSSRATRKAWSSVNFFSFSLEIYKIKIVLPKLSISIKYYIYFCYDNKSNWNLPSRYLTECVQ